MPGEFTRTLDEIDRLLIDLRDRYRIVIEPLTGAVNDLRRHTESIEKIEANTEAIREEVLKPIKVELEANKKAGRFSVFGFYVGAIGLLASIISLGYGMLRTSPLDDDLRRNLSDIKASFKASQAVQKVPSIHGLEIKDGDRFVPRTRYVLGTWHGTDIEMSVPRIRGDRAFVFFYGPDGDRDRPFRPGASDGPIRLRSSRDRSASPYSGYETPLEKGDVIVIGDHQIQTIDVIDARLRGAGYDSGIVLRDLTGPPQTIFTTPQSRVK